jgi:hypothetical protein
MEIGTLDLELFEQPIYQLNARGFVDRLLVFTNKTLPHINLKFSVRL